MPLVRKTYARKKCESVCESSESMKENINVKRTLTRASKDKALKKLTENVLVDSHSFSSKGEKTNDAFDFVSSPLKQKDNFKPLSFWGQKVKDLESKDHGKKKKFELYDLSETDDSFSSKQSRKPKRKVKANHKKKQANKITCHYNIKNAIKRKEPTSKEEREKECSIFQEKLILKKLYEDKTEQKFTFNQVSKFGLTSTPGKSEKLNVVGGSSFDFLSPIPSECSSGLCLNIADENIERIDATPRRLRTRKTSNRESSLVTDADFNEEYELRDPFSEAFIANDSHNDSIHDRNATINIHKLQSLLNNLSISTHKFGTKLFESKPLKLPNIKTYSLPSSFTVEDLSLEKFSVVISGDTDIKFRSSDKSTCSKVTKRRPINFLNFRRSASELNFEIISNANVLRSNVCDGAPHAEETLIESHKTLKMEAVTQQTPRDSAQSNQCISNVVEEKNKCFKIGNDILGFHLLPEAVVEVANCRNAGGKSPQKIISKECKLENTDKCVRENCVNKLAVVPEISEVSYVHVNKTNFSLESACVIPVINKKDLTECKKNLSKNSCATNKTNTEIMKLNLKTDNYFSSITSVKKWSTLPIVVGKLANDEFKNLNFRKKRRNYQSLAGKVSPTKVGSLTINSEKSSVKSSIRERLKFNPPILEDENIFKKNQKSRRSSTFHPEIHCGTKSVDFASSLGTEEDAASAKDAVLQRCKQRKPLPFNKYFNQRTLNNFKKIGEGSFAEIFFCPPNRVLKIIPIEGKDPNGENLKTWSEIEIEMIVTEQLSELRKASRHRTNGFCKVKGFWCVVGKYPKHLVQLWVDFSRNNDSYTNHPSNYKSSQLYIIMELENGGIDLDAFNLTSTKQILAILRQLAFTMAVAEKSLEFEHRDLHLGNILIAQTDRKYTKVVLDDKEHRIATEGVIVTVIDYTLSRITYNGRSLFSDLSKSPELFNGKGDYQYDIYRKMKKEVQDDWSVFKPKTNVLWLHYLVVKMLNKVRLGEDSDAREDERQLKGIKKSILEYSDCEQLSYFLS